MNGFLVRKGEKYYTYFTQLFLEVPDLHTKYNWLISDVECNINWCNKEQIEENCYWFEGEELLTLLKTREIQWIWGVFSGIPKEIPFSDIQIKHVPYANGNPDIWRKPITIQYSLAEVELIAWDSTLTVFIGKSKSLIEKIRKIYPFAEPL